MILKHTVLKVSDNSGARFVKCIGIQKYKKCKQVSFKTVITVTLTKVKLDKLNESVYLKRVREIRKEEKKKNDAKKRALRESADRDGKNNIEEKIEVKKVQVPKQIVVDFKNTYLKQLYKGLIVTTKKTWRRTDGSRARTLLNRCFLLNEKNLLFGTRVFGPIPKEFKKFKNFIKTASLYEDLYYSKVSSF